MNIKLFISLTIDFASCCMFVIFNKHGTNIYTLFIPIKII